MQRQWQRQQQGEAGVIDARSLIMAIEREGSKPSLMLLDNATALRKQMNYIVHVKALLGEGVGGLHVFACSQS